VTADGTRYVTDNLYIPFGGFFPEHWMVERSPWTRSLPALIKRHRARLAAVGAEVVSFATEPLEDMHTSQHEIDRINTELGFLHPHNEREDLGKFTQEGRYRVWKEIWMLNYLGRAARYCEVGRVGCLAADVAHLDLGLHGTVREQRGSLIAVMVHAAAPDAGYEGRERVVVETGAQRTEHIPAERGKEACVELAISGKPGAVTIAAERFGH
jgi:hypothetical protein